VIGDLKHSLFTAILILLSYVASVLIVRERYTNTPDDFRLRVSSASPHVQLFAQLRV
jgi:hypothetical protein